MNDEERALMRLHTDASGVPGPKPGTGRVWLNSVDVVNKIIRAFTKDMLAVVERGGDAMAGITFESTRMNNLFLGITPSAHFDIGPWNRPDQLGEYILTELGLSGDTHYAVRDAFMWYSNEVLKVFQSSDDEASRGEINRLVGRLRDALLGLPANVTGQ